MALSLTLTSLLLVSRHGYNLNIPTLQQQKCSFFLGCLLSKQSRSECSNDERIYVWNICPDGASIEVIKNHIWLGYFKAVILTDWHLGTFSISNTWGCPWLLPVYLLYISIFHLFQEAYTKKKVPGQKIFGQPCQEFTPSSSPARSQFTSFWSFRYQKQDTSDNIVLSRFFSDNLRQMTKRSPSRNNRLGIKAACICNKWIVPYRRKAGVAKLIQRCLIERCWIKCMLMLIAIVLAGSRS